MSASRFDVASAGELTFGSKTKRRNELGRPSVSCLGGGAADEFHHYNLVLLSERWLDICIQKRCRQYEYDSMDWCSRSGL